MTGLSSVFSILFLLNKPEDQSQTSVMRPGNRHDCCLLVIFNSLLCLTRTPKTLANSVLQYKSKKHNCHGAVLYRGCSSPMRPTLQWRPLLYYDLVTFTFPSFGLLKESSIQGVLLIIYNHSLSYLFSTMSYLRTKLTFISPSLHHETPENVIGAFNTQTAARIYLVFFASLNLKYLTMALYYFLSTKCFWVPHSGL